MFLTLQFIVVNALQSARVQREQENERSREALAFSDQKRVKKQPLQYELKLKVKSVMSKADQQVEL